MPLLDGKGKLLPYVLEARKRGVIFDVGHGGGSFVFRQAVPAMKQGFWPDSISTDLHINSMNGGMKDMTNLMSKFLAMGMPLKEVIARATAASRPGDSPARAGAPGRGRRRRTWRSSACARGASASPTSTAAAWTGSRSWSAS